MWEDSENEIVETDVLVIGAGYAGLAAALRVHDAGVDVTVVEAAERVGGRAWSEQLAGGPRVDHGGQWAGPTQHRLLALAGRFGCATFPTWETGEHIEIWRDGSRAGYTGAAPDEGAGIAEYHRVTALLDEFARTVDTAAPWRTPRMREWDAQTAASFFAGATSDAAARARLALAVQGVWCAEPYEISLFHVLFYIASAGSYEQLMETSGCAQDRRFVDGADAPARAVARVLADRVRCGERVTLVEQLDAGVRVRTSRTTYEASRAIIAVPPPAVRSMIFDPALPVAREGWLAHTPMGRVAKIHAVYPSPFWRAAGRSGIGTLYDAGPAGVVYDNSPADGSSGVLVAFVYGDRASAWLGRACDERRRELLAALCRVVGPAAARPTDYTEALWSLDPYARGGYEAYVTPGGWTGYAEHGWREPTGLLHWAGTETASTWNGYIDGAISSGERAAGEVLTLLAALVG